MLVIEKRSECCSIEDYIEEEIRVARIGTVRKVTFIQKSLCVVHWFIGF